MRSRIDILRHFRDKRLLENPLGRAFVQAYYRYSTPVAEFIAQSPVGRWLVRALLVPVLFGLSHPLELLVIICLLTAAAIMVLVRALR